jgi:hypothetical protein
MIAPLLAGEYSSISALLLDIVEVTLALRIQQGCCAKRTDRFLSTAFLSLLAVGEYAE